MEAYFKERNQNVMSENEKQEFWDYCRFLNNKMEMPCPWLLTKPKFTK